MEDIIEEALDYGKEMNAQYVEIRLQKGSITSINIKDRNVQKTSIGLDVGGSIRVLYNGAWGIVSITNITKEEVLKAVKEAIKIARGASNMVKMPVRLSEVKPVQDKVKAELVANPADVSGEEKISTLLTLSDGLLKFDNRIKSVEIDYADMYITQYYGNTDQTYVEQEKVYVWSRIVGSAKENEVFTSARHELGSTKGYIIWKEDPPGKIVEKMGKRLTSQLKAKPPKAGVWPAVLAPEVVGVFTHEAFGHLGEADLAFSGAVTLQKIGQKVASEHVTIIDDGTIPGAFGSFAYDDEGVPAQKTVLVKDGILVSFMYNREFAAKFEDFLRMRFPQLLEVFNTKPTGNARAENFRYEPIIRMRNTYIAPKDYTFEELLEDIKFGYYFKAFRGGQANLDGTFQVGIQEAYEIINGEIGNPVRNVSISGNTLETLMKVDAVGKDFELHSGRCGKGQLAYVGDGGPHIRVKKITVGGEA